MFAHFAGNVVLELGQVRAFGLRHIEDVDRAKANQHGRGLAVVVLRAVAVGVVFPAAVSNHRGENLDSLFAALHKPAQLLPRVEPGDAGRRWALPRNAQNVPERVVMETGHCREIRGQSFALARFKLLEQVIHGLLDELLRGVVALRGALLVGGFAAVRRIFAVRRGGGVVVGAGSCVGHDFRLLRSGICRF